MDCVPYVIPALYVGITFNSQLSWYCVVDSKIEMKCACNGGNSLAHEYDPEDEYYWIQEELAEYMKMINQNDYLEAGLGDS